MLIAQVWTRLNTAEKEGKGGRGQILCLVKGFIKGQASGKLIGRKNDFASLTWL